MSTLNLQCSVPPTSLRTTALVFLQSEGQVTVDLACSLDLGYGCTVRRRQQANVGIPRFVIL